VACLPGGHPIDLAWEVRYGIIGEPVRDTPGERPRHCGTLSLCAQAARARNRQV